MATQFQTRLVGTIILVAVGVIFFPEVLDGDKKKKEPLFASIPIQPKESEKKPLIDAFSEAQITESQAQPQADTPVQKIKHQEQALPSEVKGIVLKTKKTPEKKLKVQKSAEHKPKLVKKEAKPKTSEKPKQSNKPIAFTDSAWLIQMGYFNNAENALILKNKLIKSGYQAHSEPKKPIDGQLTRVFIGPELSKVKLEAYLKPIAKLTGVKGKILPFKPLEPGAE